MPLVAALLIPAYMVNEWLVLDGGLGVTKGFVRHCGLNRHPRFRRILWTGPLSCTHVLQARDQPIESDETSDRFSMLGSMVLWIFWPSFCSAVAPSEQMPKTVINTILALCGATLATCH